MTRAILFALLATIAPAAADEPPPIGRTVDQDHGVGDQSSWLRFGEAEEGSWEITSDEGAKRGDLEVIGGGPIKIAVAPGRYLLRHRGGADGAEHAGVVTVAPGEERWVHLEELSPGALSGRLRDQRPPAPSLVPAAPAWLDDQAIFRADEERARRASRAGTALIVGGSIAAAWSIALFAGFAEWHRDRSSPSLLAPAAGLSLAGSGLLVGGLILRAAARRPIATALSFDEEELRAVRRLDRRRRAGAGLLAGGLSSLTAGSLLSLGSQAIRHDKDSFPVLTAGLTLAALGGAMTVAGGVLHHSGSVAAAPFALRDGGGLAVGGVF